MLDIEDDEHISKEEHGKLHVCKFISSNDEVFSGLYKARQIKYIAYKIFIMLCTALDPKPGQIIKFRFESFDPDDVHNSNSESTVYYYEGERYKLDHHKCIRIYDDITLSYSYDSFVGESCNVIEEEFSDKGYVLTYDVPLTYEETNTDSAEYVKEDWMTENLIYLNHGIDIDDLINHEKVKHSNSNLDVMRNENVVLKL